MKYYQLLLFLLLFLSKGVQALPLERSSSFEASEKFSPEVVKDAKEVPDALLPQAVSFEAEKFSFEYSDFHYSALYTSKKDCHYLFLSLLIVPGLDKTNIIFPFHFFL